jgi:ketosteroid isomerase-like protein
MRPSRFTLSALLAAAALSLPVVSARADDKSDIHALYGKILAAMKAKDTKAIMALGTPDFVSIDHGTKMNAQQTAQMMDMQFKMMKSMDSMKMNVEKLDIKGKNAAATTNYAFKVKMTGQDGKLHTISDSGITKDTLVKTGKGWLFKTQETISQHSMMDGKPMPMPAPPMPASKKK